MLFITNRDLKALEIYIPYYMIYVYHKIILKKVTILEKTMILRNVKDTEVREFVINDRLKY